MNYHWDWQFFFQEADDGLKYYEWVISGLGWTTAVSLASLAVALLLGSVLGVMRTTPTRWLVAIGDAYVDVFRNVPLIIQLFLWFFVLRRDERAAVQDWIRDRRKALPRKSPSPPGVGDEGFEPPTSSL